MDFYCAKCKLVIELDGSQHYEPGQEAKDRERTAYLNSLGLKVVRFSNHEVDANFKGVCEAIEELIKDAM